MLLLLGLRLLGSDPGHWMRIVLLLLGFPDNIVIFIIFGSKENILSQEKVLIRSSGYIFRPNRDTSHISSHAFPHIPIHNAPNCILIPISHSPTRLSITYPAFHVPEEGRKGKKVLYLFFFCRRR